MDILKCLDIRVTLKKKSLLSFNYLACYTVRLLFLLCLFFFHASIDLRYFVYYQNLLSQMHKTYPYVSKCVLLCWYKYICIFVYTPVLFIFSQFLDGSIQLSLFEPRLPCWFWWECLISHPKLKKFSQTSIPSNWNIHIGIFFHKRVLFCAKCLQRFVCLTATARQSGWQKKKKNK